MDTSPPTTKLEAVTQRIERYRLLAWIIGVIILSLGFGFRTPQSQFTELRKAIGTNSDRMAKIEARVYQLEHDDRIGALIRLKCSELTPKEIVQFDVPCGTTYPTTP